MKTDLVKGFNDYSGKEAEKRMVIQESVKNILERYGFQPAETPVIESREFVKGPESQDKDEAVSSIFSLKDKGKRDLALRYEFTFQLKRLMKNKKLPYKCFQMGPVFRDEPVKKNRTRQFIQCDADIVGTSIKDEADLFAAMNEILNKLKIKGTIYFNNRKLINEILEKQNINEKNRNQVIREVDKLDKLPEKDVQEKLKRLDAGNILKILKQKEESFKEYSSYSEIIKLKEICKNYGIKIVFSPYLARGLSYYDGTIFEVKTNKIRETIFGGGAYTFNDVPSIGFSASLERLSVVTNLVLKLDKTLLVSINKDKETIKLAQRLRSRGRNVTIYYGKPSKALEYANSYNINRVIFVGEKEIKTKKFKIKEMKTGKEVSVVESKL